MSFIIVLDTFSFPMAPDDLASRYGDADAAITGVRVRGVVLKKEVWDAGNKT